MQKLVFMLTDLVYINCVSTGRRTIKQEQCSQSCRLLLIRDIRVPLSRRELVGAASVSLEQSILLGFSVNKMEFGESFGCAGDRMDMESAEESTSMRGIHDQ